MRKSLLFVVVVAALAAAGPVRSQTAAPAGAASIYATTTVDAFLAACKRDQAGCMSEVANALLMNMTYDGSANICLPSIDYGTPVPGWLDSHPEAHALPVEKAIYTALQSLYPCGRG